MPFLAGYWGDHLWQPGQADSALVVDDGYLNLGQNDIEVMSTYNLEELDWTGCDVVWSARANSTTATRRAYIWIRVPSVYCCPRPAKTWTGLWFMESITTRCKSPTA